MRGLVATTAVLGVLVIGGLPALALTLAADEAQPGRAPATVLEDAPRDDAPRSDPPPGWVRNHGGATPHGWAVREWAHCRGDAARDGAHGDAAEARCGAKPAPPGHLKHAHRSDKAEKPGQQDKPEKTKKPKKPGDDG